MHIKLCQEFVKAENNPSSIISNFTGAAFVTFKYQHYRDAILKKFREEKDKFEYRDQQLKVTRAVHPSEVLWLNLRFSDKARRIKMFFSFLVLFGFLFIAFECLIFTEEYRDFLMAFVETKGDL